MKRKYICSGCKGENIVVIPDITNLGMGRGGAMATEFGLGGAMMGGPFGGGLPFGGRNLPRDIVHNCTHCGVKNVIKLNL